MPVLEVVLSKYPVKVAEGGMEFPSPERDDLTEGLEYLDGFLLVFGREESVDFEGLEGD